MSTVLDLKQLRRFIVKEVKRLREANPFNDSSSGSSEYDEVFDGIEEKLRVVFADMRGAVDEDAWNEQVSLAIDDAIEQFITTLDRVGNKLVNNEYA